MQTLHPTKRESRVRVGEYREEESEETGGVLTLDGGNDVSRRDSSQSKKDRHLTDHISCCPERRRGGELVAVPVEESQRVREVADAEREETKRAHMPRSSFIPDKNALLMFDWSRFSLQRRKQSKE